MATIETTPTEAETALLRGECERCKSAGILVGGLCLYCDRAARDARAIDDAKHAAAVLDERLQAAHQRIGALEAELSAERAAKSKTQSQLTMKVREQNERIDAIDAIKHGGIRQLLMIAAGGASPDIREILGKFQTSTKCYSELQDLIISLLAKSDEYEASQEEIDEWLAAWD